MDRVERALEMGKMPVARLCSAVVFGVEGKLGSLEEVAKDYR